jgi:hypothetical protein
MSFEGDRKHCVDAKCKKHGFSYTVSNVFALNGRHLGFAPTGHAFDHSSRQSSSIISILCLINFSTQQTTRVFIKSFYLYIHFQTSISSTIDQLNLHYTTDCERVSDNKA